MSYLVGIRRVVVLNGRFSKLGNSHDSKMLELAYIIKKKIILVYPYLGYLYLNISDFNIMHVNIYLSDSELIINFSSICCYILELKFEKLICNYLKTEPEGCHRNLIIILGLVGYIYKYYLSIL